MVKQPQTCEWGVGRAMTKSDSESLTARGQDLISVRGWAGYCRASSAVHSAPDLDSLRSVIRQSPSWLPVGSGCSYGDAALNDGGTLIRSSFPDRLQSDCSDGLVWVHAAMPLGELLAQLSTRGWSLPVVPGVLSATVGGMVAADVHGKNHIRHGSFGNSVEALDLILPDGQRLHCTREEESEIFHATLGGMGLTGAITAVALKVVPRSESVAEVRVVTTENLDETLEILQRSAVGTDHSSAWVDYSLRSPRKGRGVVVGGNLLPISQGSEMNQLWQPQSGPGFPPLPTPGEKLVFWHNNFYHLLSRWKSDVSYWPLEKLLFPLEAWSSWKRVYEPLGFHQHQSLIPESAGPDAVKALFDLVTGGGISPTLVVIKRMGDGRGGLSFPARGWTVSIDFAHTSGVVSLLEKMNAFTAETGGRVYLAKDSTLSAELFRQMYPSVGDFMQIRHRVDPERRIRSCLAERLEM